MALCFTTAKLLSGERKCAYLCCFGLAPHFKQLLSDKIKNEDGFVLLFDESLNHKCKTKQMDIHVRLWDGDHVTTRYYGSQFMGHATATDMVGHFKEATAQLNMRNVLQLSMDGPNVNWKFHDLMNEDMQTDFGKSLINIGSCGLHVVNGAFKDGCVASEWKLKDLFLSLTRIFKDTPARREDFEKVTGSSVFPLKFCSHRWLENIPVAERALLIWPNLETYVKKVNEKKVPNPRTVSFDVIKGACADPFIKAKINFFLSVARQLVPFLTIYQCDKPMVPFLCDDLHRMIRGLLQRFMKTDVLKEADTIQKLLQVPFCAEDKKEYLPHKKVDVGFVAQEQLKQLIKGKRASERGVMEFRMNCRGFLEKTTKKIMDKAPIKYSLIRNMSCLNPRFLATDREAALSKMKSILIYLAGIHLLRGGMDACDDLMREFTEFVDTVVAANSASFKSFDHQAKDSQVDTFLHDCMATSPAYKKIWDQVVSKLLLLSHGQASVERGFSINKEIEVENLHEQSVVGQRVVYDHIHSVGGILKVELTNGLLVSAGSARQRYHAYLDEQNAARQNEESKNKRKCLFDEVEEIRTKKKRILADIESLNKTADKLAEKAERTGQIPLITQSNSLRKTAKAKDVELKDLGQKLEDKMQSIKEL